MTWMKVDDGFYDHPKVAELPNSAVGLWVKAGSWCSKHLTDGVIPASRVKALKGTSSQVRALIECGLWSEVSADRAQSGTKSYAFRSWGDYQPTREQKEKERADAAERQREYRERKRQEQGQRENVTRDSHVTPSRDSHESNRGVSQRPDPTRPDPTRPSSPNGEENTLAQPSGSSERDRVRHFDEFWSACPRKVGKQKARAKYAAAVKRAGGEQPVIDGMRRLAADPNLPETQFVPHPTTWLERNGWEDDPLPPRLSTVDEPQRRFGTRPEDWLPPPEDPGDYVDGEVVDTQELEA